MSLAVLYKDCDNYPEFPEGLVSGLTSLWIPIFLQLDPQVHFMVNLLYVRASFIADYPRPDPINVIHCRAISHIDLKSMFLMVLKIFYIFSKPQREVFLPVRNHHKTSDLS